MLQQWALQRKKWIYGAIAGVVALFLTVVLLNSPFVMSYVREELVAGLRQGLGVRVDIGQVKATWGLVVMEDVAVYDRQERILLQTPKISAALSWRALLGGKKGSEVVDTLWIWQPEFSFRQHSDGIWNIAELGQEEKKTGEKSAFRGRVVVQGGCSQIYALNQKGRVSHQEIQLDFSRENGVQIAAGLEYGQSPFTIAGIWAQKGQGELILKADKVDLAKCQDLIQPAGAVTALSGSLTLGELRIAVKNNAIDSWVGEVNAEKVGIQMSDMDWQDIEGKIYFFNREIACRPITGKLWGQKVSLNGTADFSQGTPWFRMRIQAHSFDAAVAMDHWGADGRVLKGRINADFQGEGTPAYWTLDGSGESKELVYEGTTVQKMSVKVRMAGTQMDILSAEGNVWGGTLHAAGSVDWKSRSYYLQVQGVGLDTARISGAEDTGILGKGDGDILIDGQGDLSGALITGTARVTNGEVKGIPFQLLETRFAGAKNNLSFPYINLLQGNGGISAWGWLHGDNMDFQFQGTDVPVSMLQAKMPDVTLAGWADFTGQVGGTLENPQGMVNWTARDGEIMGQPFLRGEGQLVFSSRELLIRPTIFFDGKARHDVMGTVSMAGGTSVDLQVGIRRARAEKLAAIAVPGENITGNVDADMVMRGPVNNLNMYGKILLTEGSYRGQLISLGEGNFRVDNGVTRVEDMIVECCNARFSISGVMNAGKKMDFAFSAKEVDVSKLPYDFPYTVEGRANVIGKITGMPENPLVEGDVTAEEITVNGQAANQVKASFQAMPQWITLSSLTFNQRGGAYQFSGSMDLVKDVLQGNLEVKNGDLAGIMAAFKFPDRGLQGRLYGNAVIAGTFDQPDLWITGELKEGKLKNYPLEHVDLDMTLEGDVLTIQQFLARQGKGVLAIKGTADFDGAVKMEVGGRDIDAGLLTAWFDAPYLAKGSLSFAAQVSGATEKPHTDMSLEIIGGGVGNATFDNLFGLFMVENGNINVQQLFIAKGEYKASAYGVIPIKALSGESNSPGSHQDEMDIKVKLDNANLSILPLLTKEVAWAVGPTQGELQVGGTLVDPTVYGRISIADGAMKLNSFAEPLQKVNMDIVCNGSQIDIKQFQGQMGSGTFSVTGGALLKNMGFEKYNLSLQADNLGISHKYFRGPIRGQLQLAKENGKPEITGKLLIDRTTVTVPYQFPEGGNLPDWRINVELQVGDRTRMYDPFLYDVVVGGNLKFSGTLQDPKVQGSIRAAHGTLKYLTTRFRILEAQVEFTRHRSWEPVLHLTAETKVDNTVITLMVDGPVGGLNVKLSSDPAMRQEDIIAFLNTRSLEGGSAGLWASQLSGIFSTGITMRLFSTVEDTVRDLLGLDEFYITKVSSATNGIKRESYQLQMSKRVMDRLFISGALGQESAENRFQIKYDFGKDCSVVATKDEKGQRIMLEKHIRF